MEEEVCINDYGQGCASDGDCNQTNQLDNMDITLVSSFLELDEEDLSEIHRMVDEWEFNFGSIESSDGEELLRLVQIDNPCQFSFPRPTSSAATNSCPDWIPNNEELHDRLPSYYTALAPSRSAPWIPPAAQQVFNKLPAYITDIASPLDAADISGPCGQPSKKKLNLAEYRTRREKQMQEAAAEQQQKVQQEQEVEEIEKKANVKKESTTDIEPKRVRVKVESDKIKSPIKESVKVKDEPEEGEVEEEEVIVEDQVVKNIEKVSHKSRLSRPVESSSTASRMRSSRSPTRSYSSDSRSSSRRYRSTSSSSSSYSSRSRSRSPSYRRGRRRRRRSSRSPSWRRNRRRSRRRTPSPPPRCRYNERSRRETERQRQIEERRVIYVGKLAEGTTRADLRHRFEPFGPVVDISLHFRERGDNYGFVTFAYKVDAYEAVEHGNDDPHLPKYDLSFGGRRSFCKETYADLDAVDDDGRSKANDVDFETLLRAVQVQLHRRPCS